MWMDSVSAEHRWGKGPVGLRKTILVRMTCLLASDQQFQAVSPKERSKISAI